MIVFIDKKHKIILDQTNGEFCFGDITIELNYNIPFSIKQHIRKDEYILISQIISEITTNYTKAIYFFDHIEKNLFPDDWCDLLFISDKIIHGFLIVPNISIKSNMKNISQRLLNLYQLNKDVVNFVPYLTFNININGTTLSVYLFEYFMEKFFGRNKNKYNDNNKIYTTEDLYFIKKLYNIYDGYKNREYSKSSGCINTDLMEIFNQYKPLVEIIY